MPEKDGDEGKSTKSVVNKKQKQMMGEEGYDIARDMGRVRPSKDKKDATTMPPSKEMEKTRKVNKGPSALERVKKKYKGQIMDVKKEELDLTQVAEAFGGYIIESSFDNIFNPKKEVKITTTGGKEVQGQLPMGGEFAKGRKSRKKRSDSGTSRGKRNVKGSDNPDQGNVFNQKKPEQLSAGQKKLAAKAGLDMSKIEAGIKPPTAAQSAAMQAARDMQQSGQKLTKDVKKGMYQVATGEVKDLTPRPYTPRAKRAKRATPKQLEKTRAQVAKADAKEKAKMYKSPETGRMTRRTKKVSDTPLGIVDRRIKVAAQKTKQMAAKGAQAAVAKVREKPFPTTFGAVVIAGTVRDMFRGMPKIPAPPKVKGGTVGRRTAG